MVSLPMMRNNPHGQRALFQRSLFQAIAGREQTAVLLFWFLSCSKRNLRHRFWFNPFLPTKLPPSLIFLPANFWIARCGLAHVIPLYRSRYRCAAIALFADWAELASCHFFPFVFASIGSTITRYFLLNISSRTRFGIFSDTILSMSISTFDLQTDMVCTFLLCPNIQIQPRAISVCFCFMRYSSKLKTPSAGKRIH